MNTSPLSSLSYAFKETPTLWFMPRESYHNMVDYAACLAIAKAAGLEVVGCTMEHMINPISPRIGLVLEGKTNGYLDALLHLVPLNGLNALPEKQSGEQA